MELYLLIHIYSFHNARVLINPVWCLIFILLGPDCSLNVPSTESYWILPNVKPFSPSVGRASHKAVLHGKFMWVIGGYTFNYGTFQMVLK